MEKEIKIFNQNNECFLKNTQEKFKIIYLDPPYNTGVKIHIK